MLWPLLSPLLLRRLIVPRYGACWLAVTNGDNTVCVIMIRVVLMAVAMVTGPQVPSVPRCGVSGPFRGHLSTKSNAFCIGQSCRLSDQFRVRDHLLAHYNKILTAKAAVDCSVPKSMTKSIKYSDQQRRERMKREVTRLERSSPHSTASSRPTSRESLNSASHHKELYSGYDHGLRHSPYSDPGPARSPSCSISSPRRFQSPEFTADYSRRPPDPSRLSSGSSAWAAAATRRFQDNRQKTYSGDLLEKHAQRFTDQQRPFTPRTLRSGAASVLAHSRYYTPPRRKRGETDSRVQTSMGRGQHGTSEGPSPLNNGEKDEDAENLLDDEDEADYCDPHLMSTSRMSLLDLKSPSPTTLKVRSEEEELAYLKFVADVTNEILTLGLFSDRVIDRIFDRHLQDNKHRLDEDKMHHLLGILRADLNAKDDTKLDLFSGHSLHSNTSFSNTFCPQDTTRNNGFLSQRFSLEDLNWRKILREDVSTYLNDKSPRRPNVLSSQSARENFELSKSQSCHRSMDIDRQLSNNVHGDQEDNEATQRSRETVENKSDTSHQKEDLLPLREERNPELLEEHLVDKKTSPVGNVLLGNSDMNQRSRESVVSICESKSDTSHQKDDLLPLQEKPESPAEGLMDEKSSSVGNVILGDSNRNQGSDSQDVALGLSCVTELDRDVKFREELKDLEQSFSEIVQVSKLEGGMNHDQDTDATTDLSDDF